MSASPFDPWDVSESDFPAGGGSKEKLGFLLNYAILAPSSHNTQPWLFRLPAEDTVELYADRTRGLPVVDPSDRELTISCGAALFHLITAASHFGYSCSVETLPDEKKPDLLARAVFKEGGKAGKEDERLFYAITKRRTNRMPFEDRVVPKKLLTELQEAAGKEGAWFVILREAGIKNTVADLISEGDRLQAKDRLFRRELASWVRQNRGRSRDGMPGYALGLGDIASLAGPFMIRTFDWGDGQAAKDRQLAAGSPVLSVLGTDADTPKEWLKAGQAMAKVILHACSEGLSASFLNQPVEVPDLRHVLRDLLGVHGFPQLIIRMGYGPEIKPTPRRDVNDALI